MNFPKFHKNLLAISLYHRQTILEKYSDILGLNNIDHISINVVDPNDELIFLSSTPLTGINVCSGKLYLYDLSIHPSMYMNKDFYWWNECYAPQMKDTLILEKEEKDLEHWLISENYQDIYRQMGRYCFNNVKNLYAELTENEVNFTL